MPFADHDLPVAISEFVLCWPLGFNFGRFATPIRIPNMGETREERIIQFLEENDASVVGLREGAMLRIENGETVLRGSSGARIFRRGLEPVDTLPSARLDNFLH